MGRLFKSFFITVIIISVCSSKARAYVDEGRPSLLSISGYKPIYFIMGKPNTKIQISLKAQLVAWVPVYMGYTQTMFWELFQYSPYFSDIIYSPDLFYRINLQTKMNSWIDISPFDHESNGKGGLLERSWNRAYVRYTNTIKLSEQTSLMWSLKLWVPYSHNPNSPDLAQYRVSWEGTVTLSNFLGSFFDINDLTLVLYGGGPSTVNPLQGGQMLSLRAKIKSWSFLPLFYGQIFHGRGETLLNYKDETLGLRFGLGF